MRRAASALVCAVLLAGAGLSGCGSDDAGDESGSDGDESAERAAEEALPKAADQSTCVADAEEVAAPYADDFPEAWQFPPETTVYNVEDRGDTGVIVTGISSASFDDVLDFLNTDEVAAGFEITEGETEEDDAEANWVTDDGQRGRWTIQKSSSCPGEIVIQVLASPPA